MALSGTISADGATSSITGLQGNVDVNIRMSGGDRIDCWLQVSYDAGTTWQNLAHLGNSTVSKLLVAGDSSAYYRFKFFGITGTESADYYLGQD